MVDVDGGPFKREHLLQDRGVLLARKSTFATLEPSARQSIGLSHYKCGDWGATAAPNKRLGYSEEASQFPEQPNQHGCPIRCTLRRAFDVNTV